jgi:predicted RND superfamily exporter protein
VIRRRWWVLGACALLSLISVWSISHGVVATSVGQMLLGENPHYETYVESSERFGGDQAIVVGIDDPDILSPAGQERLRGVIAQIERYPEVDWVESVLDAQRLEPGVGLGPPRVVRHADGVNDAAAGREVLSSLGQHRHYGGVLVGRDGACSAAFVHLITDEVSAAEALPELVNRVTAAFHVAYPAGAIHPVGFPVVTAEVLRQTVHALAVTTPVVGFVLLFTVWLLFRRVWPAALSLLVAGIGALWAMGLAVALEPQVNMLTAFVPALMLIIAFSDVVHLCSAYLLELDEQEDKEAAVVAACAEVGRACLFTSLTTGIGFLCISLIPTPAFRVLGVVLGCGVGLALLLAVTLTPILLHWLPRPKPLREGATAGAQAVIDRLLAGCQSLATGRPKLVVAIFGVLTVLAVGGASRLTIETDFSKRISASNPVRQDQEWFAARFVGANLIQVYVDAPDGLADAPWFRGLARLQARAKELRGVERAASWVDLVEQVYPVTPGGRLDREHALPADDGGLSLLLRLILTQAGPELDRLVDREQERVRLIVNVHGDGMRTTGAIATEIDRIGAEELGDGVVVATGLSPLLGQWLDEIVVAQRDGMLISVGIIALVMTLGLRSLRVGLGSMPPNLFPLLIVVACLGVFWDQVDSDCIALTFVALGIGVDDTIHFLSRLRLESSRQVNITLAIERTFGFAGRGIVMTTTILALGFLPLLLSDYFLMRMFGSLLPLCMVVALIADLLLVPAMAQLGWLQFARPRGSDRGVQVTPETA